MGKKCIKHGTQSATSSITNKKEYKVSLSKKLVMTMII